MIPAYMRNHENGLKNFSLHFDKFSQWDKQLRADQPPKAKIEYHTNVAQSILKHSDNALRILHKRQSKSLRSVHQNGGFCLEITAKLVTPYVSGLGGCHPTETGFILDRNTGLPYIPASAIKGVLRLAHALDIAKPDLKPNEQGDYEIPDSEPSLRKYFGDTKTDADNAVRGQLVFLDAFPIALPTIKKDIMNPHFGKYYNGTAPPTETENPIPVMFMSVKEGDEFKFRVFALPLAEGSSVSREFDGNDRAAVLSMFKRACEELGFGAKTAVGYGRMGNVEETTLKMEIEWQIMAQEEESCHYPWRSALREIEQISTWGDFRQRILNNVILIESQVEPDVFNTVYSRSVALRKSWKAEDKIERDRIIAEWLQPSGLAWPPVEQLAVTTNNEAGAELERVKAITKWAEYLAAPANMDILSKNGLKKLLEKLEAWGCKAKDAKEEKKKVWDEVTRRMRS